MDSPRAASSSPRNFALFVAFLVGLVLGVLVSAPGTPFSSSHNAAAMSNSRTLIGAAPQALDCSDFILPRNFTCPPPPPCRCDCKVSMPSFPPCKVSVTAPSAAPIPECQCPPAAAAPVVSAPSGSCDWSAMPEEAPCAPWMGIASTGNVAGKAIISANGRGSTPQFVGPVSNFLRRLFHVDGQLVSPYAGFDPAIVPRKDVVWTLAGPLLDLIREIRPKVYVEAGVWLGTSFIAVTKELKALGLHDSYSIAIDTWLGALEFMCARNRHDLDSSRNLNPRFGYPSVYYHFLSNIVSAGIASQVVPIAQTSQLGAKYLIAKGIKAEVVYIDGSHEYDDVKADLLLYWHVLDHSNPNSAIVGDDLTWKGVKRAVDEFVALYCQSSYDSGAEAKWWLRSKQCTKVPPPPDLSEGCRE
jgi:hypothetical protein